MTVYVLCKKCHRKIKIKAKRASELPELFIIKCPYCSHEDTYSRYDAKEENLYHYRCPVCSGPFYLSRQPPIVVKCPHCNSILKIENSKLVVKKKGSQPYISSTAIGGILGAMVGGAATKGNAVAIIAGGIIGALLGNIFEEKEAIYL